MPQASGSAPRQLGLGGCFYCSLEKFAVLRSKLNCQGGPAAFGTHLGQGETQYVHHLVIRKSRSDIVELGFEEYQAE